MSRAMFIPLVALALGCSSDTPLSDVTEALSDGGTFWVMYSPDPSPIPLNEAFSVTAMVHDATDTSRMIMDASVQMDATMPMHGHGMNTTPEVSASGDGAYTGQGFLFHMEGEWELTVSIGDGETVETATFEIACCED